MLRIHCAMGRTSGRLSFVTVGVTMGRRLLIVDDEPDMLDFLDRVFRREYEVIRAQSVDEAVHHIEAGAFDVIVTDRRMPRRSGLELLEIAAQRQPHAIRVLLTGYADSLVDEKVAQWRLVDAWVSKPIDSAALKTSIAQAVEKRKPG
jgi:DNA-binding NtrC family response regulator